MLTASTPSPSPYLPGGLPAAMTPRNARCPFPQPEGAGCHFQSGQASSELRRLHRWPSPGEHHAMLRPTDAHVMTASNVHSLFVDIMGFAESIERLDSAG